MLDSALRPSKDRIVDPLAQFLAPRMQPLVLTALSLIAGVAAGVVAAHGSVFWSLPQIGHFGRGALPR